MLEESTGLARAAAAAVCWDGTMAAVVQVHIAGTDAEGRPRSEVRIREREADINAFAGCCLALFHKRPIESEAEWDHATLEIADRGHDRLAASTLSALSQLWNPTGPAALATLPAPTIGVREEAADVCLIIRAVLALSGFQPPVVIAHGVRSFGHLWTSDKWWTLLVATDAPVDWGPPEFAEVQKFIEMSPRGFSELEYYGEKLTEAPSLDRLQQAVFISTVVDAVARPMSESGPTFVDLPQLVSQQRKTAAHVPPRVWEIIRAQLHGIVASDRFVGAPDSATQVHGYVGDSPSVVLEIGATSLQALQFVRELLGERVADQVRLAIEERLPVDDAILSASKTVAQQSNHVVKLRLAREQARVIDEIRVLPRNAARRVELTALVCDLLKSDAPLDMYVGAKRPPNDRVAAGLIKLAGRWSGPPEALEVPVSKIDAEWLVEHGEAVLTTARRVGAEAFTFWVPILVEALLRAATPPARLIEALLRTNLVGLDDSAALIRHSSSATEFVRHRALQLWTSGHKLMGLEIWLPRPTKALLDEVWDRIPAPDDAKAPANRLYSDGLATLLWEFAARVRHDGPSLEWARQAALMVESNPDRMAVRALLHHPSTWLPFARDLWVSGQGHLLEGIPFDAGHLEYIARDIRTDDNVDEQNLTAPGTPSSMTELAAERLIPWLRAHQWTDDWMADQPLAVEAVVNAWQSNDESQQRAIRRYAWSMIAARSKQPRSVWLERAWSAWQAQALPDDAPIHFLRSFPTYLQVELVALGHVSLAEVEIMPQTSLPLINVLLLRGGGSYEAAVLYEIPIASTWSLIVALPPGVALPEEIAEANGEQQDVLQRAASALDELTMPFCLGVWNHTAMNWKEGRNAWVSSDGRVVCLNTDREPTWYEPMRNAFGGESAQRMLAVTAAMDAPDELLETVPRARVVRRGGQGRRGGGASDLLGVSPGRQRLFMVIAAVGLLVGALVYQLGFRGGPGAPVAPIGAQAAAQNEREATNGQPTAGAAAAETPCPYTTDGACSLLRSSYPGAAKFCQHLLDGEDSFAEVSKKPAKGPSCIRRLRSPKPVIQRYQERKQVDDETFRRLVDELTQTACAVRSARKCGEACPELTAGLRDAVLGLSAKAFARGLHNKSADRAVPNLTAAMKHTVEDPKEDSAEAWLQKAMPVSCSWRIVADANPELSEVDDAIAQDYDLLREKLPSHEQMLDALKTDGDS